ncbi:MAG: hypothetical protein HZB63_07475, partial [Deltaproteobacteria bacterium]|nr:hypothetical protein [Deltaproteobacteria bacterium]
MTETTADGMAVPENGRSRGYLDEKGFRSWALTLDHKRIGVLYLYTTL